MKVNNEIWGGVFNVLMIISKLVFLNIMQSLFMEEN